MNIKRVILAGDLSLSCPAFAVLEVDKHGIHVIHKSHVRTKTKMGTGYRLVEIEQHVKKILHSYPVTDVVVEKGFSRFHTVTHQLQRVVGVFILSLQHNNIVSFAEISPTSVKKAVTGDGKASKDVVAKNLYKYVGEQKYVTDDESDAVAVGVAYAKEEGLI